MLQDLYTRQGKNRLGSAWMEYPRPQMRRNNYANLNGTWQFAVSEKDTVPASFDKEIRVPFCPESLLSGLKMQIKPGNYMFYRRKIVIPEELRKGNVLLHFGAVDQIADIYVNQKHLCHHIGGYNSFTVDITSALEEENELVVKVLDDLRDHTLPYGKQTLKRGGMWYTPVSGIWQTVWLEGVPEAYIEKLDIRTTAQKATITVHPAQDGKVILEGQEYPLVNGSVTITPEQIRLWSPEEPNLYVFSVVTETDRVESYFALRSIEIRTINGIPRLCLNGKPYFFNGLLDQGYWSDGIYTPADETCYEYDILEMKKLGFNTLRKHIKVEPEAFYYACDRLGMVVFQDMVNNSDYSFLRDTALPTLGIQLKDTNLHKNETSRRVFLDTMEQTVLQLKIHPCILYWTIFNEAWGQFCSDAVYEKLKKLDDSRIIDATSGWFHQNQTDVDSYHIYFGSWKKLKPGKRPVVLSEFGGYAYPVEEHLFNPEKAYGYKACESLADFQASIEQLYLEKLLPAVRQGVCAAICTQVSDVEDEINGFLTYDRKVNKADTQAMRKAAKLLQQAVQETDVD